MKQDLNCHESFNKGTNTVKTQKLVDPCLRRDDGAKEVDSGSSPE